MAYRRLTRIHSVRERLGDSLSAHTNELVAIFSRLVNQGKGMLQPHQIIAEFEAVIPEGERKRLEGGAFEEVLRAAQPTFYEAFGLTLVEAMTCGLPTFATAHGGPAEIIVDGVSGYHIDLYQGDKAAELLVSFFEKCKADPTHWEKISQGGLKRIYEK